MEYEILKQNRYYRTKQEKEEGQSIITIYAYDNLDGIMMNPASSYKKSNGKHSKTVTVRMSHDNVPFAPVNNKVHDVMLQALIDIQSYHIKRTFETDENVQSLMSNVFFRSLARYHTISTAIINKKEKALDQLNTLTKEVLVNLFPTVFKGNDPKAYPIIVPSLQAVTNGKRADKTEYYKRFIKRIQTYYNTKDMVYLETPECPFAILVLPLVTKDGEPKPYHDKDRYKAETDIWFYNPKSNYIDVRAYHDHFGFLTLPQEINSKGGEIE